MFDLITHSNITFLCCRYQQRKRQIFIDGLLLYCVQISTLPSFKNDAKSCKKKDRISFCNSRRNVIIYTLEGKTNILFCHTQNISAVQFI